MQRTFECESKTRKHLARFAIQREANNTAPIFAMVPARSWKYQIPCFSTVSVAIENVVLKEVVTETWRVVMNNLERKPEVVVKLCNYLSLQARLKHCLSDTCSTRKRTPETRFLAS